MRFQAVLIDIDDTLFDFRQSSFEAMEKSFAHWHLPFSRADMAAYEVHNDALWKQYERGEIPKAFIFPERFRRYFTERGLNLNPDEFNAFYLARLAEGRAFMPHCRELLEALHGRFKVFVVTNGDTFAQESRIARSGLAHLFDGVFISEKLHCRKPEKEFFDKVFDIVGKAYQSCSLIVGDSLTSDMQGGRNAGIPTCFYGKPENADERCDFVIEDLLDLLPILEES